MINIQKKEDCCGCTACANACPKKCIVMEPDEEGFLYPQVRKDLCIDCGLCEKVCPVIKKANVTDGERFSYAVRSKDPAVLENSTSGGFFTPIARYILSQGGIICAATYNENWLVLHDFITETTDDDLLSKYRGSKYVQSDLGDCFSKIKDYIKKGKLVCFIGTTCQVNGLKKMIGDSDNLITVDLVCHGTPSPKLWKKYIDYQKEKHNSEIAAISFRNKTYGYHSGTMKIQFSNGKAYYGSARVDYMLKSFFSEISSRPICYQCPFKQIERCSDFTIYDCWHFADLVPEKRDDDKGYTNVLVQSQKGKEILNDLQKDLIIFPVEIKKAIALDGIMMEHSAKPHAKRKEFYKNFDEEELEEHINRLIPVTKKDIIIEKSKSFLYKTGLLRLINKHK